jgi:hypothetical protein
MGEVFVAYDEELDRKVALKILHTTPSGAVQRQQTLREARAAARISHPNVISVYEVGESDGHIYIAMEYVEGESLDAWQAQGSHAWTETLAIYLDAGAGLLAAHQAEVVHRDFKPDNILLGTDGRPRVVDFGLARLNLPPELLEAAPDGSAPPEAEVSGRLTLPGIISGTPGYMSPEQYRGGDVDHRSDQWSFCAALFEALYGYLPFPTKNQSLRAYAESVRAEARPPPSDTKVPEDVHRVLMRGLSADPADRFPSLAELLDTLSQEHQDNAAAGKLARARFYRTLLVAIIFIFAWVQYRQSQRGISYRDALTISGITVAIVLLGGIWRRRSLLHHRFHRYLWGIILFNLVQQGLQRALGWHYHLPITQVFSFEMVVLAGSLAIVAWTEIPWLAFSPAIPLLFGFLGMMDLLPIRFRPLVYPLVMILLGVGWSRKANQAKTGADHGEFRSSPSIRTRRTTSRPSDRHVLRTPSHGVTPQSHH